MSAKKQRGDAQAQDTKVRTIIIDDQLLFRLGLRIYLAEAMSEVQVIGEADSCAEGIALAEQSSPDLILLDVSLKDRDVTEVLAELKEKVPECSLVLLANVPDSNDFALALNSSADGYLLKTISPDRLVAGLREVVQGTPWVQPELAQQMYQEVFQPQGMGGIPTTAQALTPRQLDVLRLVTRGLRNAEIARHLHISEQTVKTHIANLLRKLGLRSRLQAASYAIRHKLVEI